MSRPHKRQKLPDFIDEKNDPVEAVFDVHLNKELSDSLFVLQYPLRPAKRPYSQDRDLDEPTSGRLKPKQNKFELNFEMHQASAHYDHMSEFSSIKKRHRLTSRNIALQTNYAIGVVKNKNLFLNPVHAVCQMVPSFQYIDSKAVLDRSHETGKRAAAPARQARAIIERPWRQDNREVRKTYSQLAQEYDEEPWIDITLHDAPDSHLGLMTKITPEDVEFNIHGNEFLENLDPDRRKKLADDYEEPQIPTNGWDDQTNDDEKNEVHHPKSRTEILRLETVPDQVLAVLRNAHVITFERACDILNKHTQTEKNMIIRGLDVAAFYVHGAWVVRSKFGYTKRPRFCRDLLIGLLDKDEDGFVSRQKWADVCQIDFDTTVQIIEEIAEPIDCPEPPKGKDPKSSVWAQYGKGIYWRIKKCNFKDDFPAKHRDLYETQKQSLEARVIWMEKTLKVTGQRPAKKQDKKKMEKIQLKIFFDSLFKKFGVCSWEFVVREFERQKDQETRTGNISEFSSISPNTCRAFLENNFSGKIKHLYYRKSVQSQNLNFDQMRHLVAQLFETKKDVKRKDVKNWIDEKLNVALDDRTYKLLMNEFATGSKGIWNLKVGSYDD